LKIGRNSHGKHSATQPPTMLPYPRGYLSQCLLPTSCQPPCTSPLRKSRRCAMEKILTNKVSTTSCPHIVTHYGTHNRGIVQASGHQTPLRTNVRQRTILQQLVGCGGSLQRHLRLQRPLRLHHQAQHTLRFVRPLLLLSSTQLLFI